MPANNGGGQGSGVLGYFGQKAGVTYFGPAHGFVGFGGPVKQETVDSGPSQGGQGQHQGASHGGQVQGVKA